MGKERILELCILGSFPFPGETTGRIFFRFASRSSLAATGSEGYRPIPMVVNVQPYHGRAGCLTWAVDIRR